MKKSMKNESPAPAEVLLDAQQKRLKGEAVDITLEKADLCGLHIPGADLVGAHLNGSDMTGIVLPGAHLTGASLREADLVGANLSGADFTDADLRGADLTGARVDDAIFANARLEGTCLLSLMGEPLSLAGAHLDRVTVQLSKFTMRDIAEMVVRGAIVNENESASPSATRHELTKEAEGETPSHDTEAGEGRSPYFDKAPSYHPASMRAPSYRAPTLSTGPQRAPSYHPSSIVPQIHQVEISSRRMLLSGASTSRTVSQRMFLELNSLIEAARQEQAPIQASLKAKLPEVEELRKLKFDFPQEGETYLGVQIVSALHKGTTSRCFLAKTSSSEQVVVRVFDPNCPGAALQLPAFQRGLRLLNQLQEAGDEVDVVELVSVALDRASYVMKYYPGKSLEVLAASSLSLENGLTAIASLCRSLTALHARGMMVRSWKPSNVFVDGLDLVLGEPDMVHLKTLASCQEDLAGYRSYAAPEEVVGAGTRSPTADVYSLGKMLEFLLTGEEPLVLFGGEALIYQRERIPGKLVDIVRRATQRDPAQRYQSVVGFSSDIQSFQEEGDRAELLALIQPVHASQLSLPPPMSLNPELADRAELIEERKIAREQRLEAGRSDQLSKRRQAEVALALTGGLGGCALLLLSIISPSDLERRESLGIFLAGLLALGVFFIEGPRHHLIRFRAISWLCAACALWLLDPLSLSTLTWSRHLQGGSLTQKRAAALNLSRVGRKDMERIQLDGLRLDGADLSFVSFRGSSLRGATFTDSFLTEVDFFQADLKDAHFEGANLHGSMLEHAKNLTEATCNRYTTLPARYSCKKGYISSSASETSTQSGNSASSEGPRGQQMKHLKNQNEAETRRSKVVLPK